MLLRLDGTGPRYAQITRALCALIQSGGLAPGSRVPPSRELARDLACSRNVVLLAYEQLLLEGYLVSRRGAGTFVSPELTGPRVPRPADVLVEETPIADPLSPVGRRLVDTALQARAISRRPHRYGIDFRYGVCEPDERVVTRLRAAFATALREPRAFLYGDPAGDPGLRQQLADRLRGVRGISRTADEILITGGAQQALDICARLLLSDDDRVVVEDPGYEAANAAFLAAGGRLLPVPVDANGLDPATLPGDDTPVRLAYVTPSHQFPTGAVMPIARRHALLAWARRRGAYIIEDDYSGEFRYAGRAIEALSALDADNRVIYCGTFAKSLFPSLRLGYLVLPRGLAAEGVACKWLTDRGAPTLLQRAIGILMATGEYDRHIRRMLRRYRARRDALIRALEGRLGSAVAIAGGTAGLHIAAWLPRLPQVRVGDFIAACQARDVGVYSVAPLALLPLRRGGLLLGYGLVDVGDIERGVTLIADAYREVSGAETRLPTRLPKSTRPAKKTATKTIKRTKTTNTIKTTRTPKGMTSTVKTVTAKANRRRGRS